MHTLQRRANRGKTSTRSGQHKHKKISLQHPCAKYDQNPRSQCPSAEDSIRLRPSDGVTVCVQYHNVVSSQTSALNSDELPCSNPVNTSSCHLRGRARHNGVCTQLKFALYVRRHNIQHLSEQKGLLLLNTNNFQTVGSDENTRQRL